MTETYFYPAVPTGCKNAGLLWVNRRTLRHDGQRMASFRLSCLRFAKAHLLLEADTQNEPSQKP